MSGPPNRHEGPTAGHVNLLMVDPSWADDIAQLHARAFDSPWDAKSIETLLAADTAISFVASLSRQAQSADQPMQTRVQAPIGFVIGRLVGDDAEIITIGVDRDCRRAGAGRALIGAFQRAASRAGAERIVFEVAADSIAALALYGVTGFAEIGRRAEYYARGDGAFVDALLFGKALRQGGTVGTSE